MLEFLDPALIPAPAPGAGVLSFVAFGVFTQRKRIAAVYKEAVPVMSRLIAMLRAYWKLVTGPYPSNGDDGDDWWNRAAP
jgi:hypothetical protein